MKAIKNDIELRKPPVVQKAMCVYKFTLSDGSYYIGATTDFGDRICCHMKQYRKGKHSLSVQPAMENSSYISFEFVEFVNDITLLKSREEFHLKKHLGQPLCLNVSSRAEGSFIRGVCEYRIAKFSEKGKIDKIYNGVSEAAKDLNISRDKISAALNLKFFSKTLVLRRIDKNNNVVKPFVSMDKYNAHKVKVNKYDLKMNFIEQFESIAAASLNVGANEKYMRIHLKGTKTCKGFIFRRAEENNNIISQ